MQFANARKLDRKSGVHLGERGAPVDCLRVWYGRRGGNVKVVELITENAGAEGIADKAYLIQFKPAGISRVSRGLFLKSGTKGGPKTFQVETS